MNFVPLPALCEYVFASAAVSADNRRVGLVFVASTSRQMLDQNAISGWPMIVLDFDSQAVGGHLFDEWLPTVYARLEEFAKQCRPLNMRHAGLWIQSRGIGTAILETCAAKGFRSMNLDLLPQRKQLPQTLRERISTADSRIHGGKHVRMSRSTVERVAPYEGVTRNALIDQVFGYQSSKCDDLETELLEALCIAIHVTDEK